MDPIFSYEYTYPCIMSIIFFLIFIKKVRKKDKASNENGFTFSITILDLCLFLFVVFIGYSLYRTYGFFQIQDFYKIFVTVFIYILLRVLLSYEDKDKTLNIIALFLVILAVTEVVISLLQFIGLLESSRSSYFRVTGSFSSPADYSNYICSILGIGFYYSLGNKIKNNQYIHVCIHLSVAIILLIGILIFTQSRTAWVTSILIILIYFFIERNNIFYKNLKRTFIKKRIIIVIIGIALITFVSWTLTIKKSSTEGRMFIINNEFSILKENFLRGIGFGNFNSYYNNYQSSFFRNNPNSGYQKFASYVNVGYNEYLQISIEGGVIAMVFLGILLFRTIINIKKINSFSYIKKGFLLSLISLLLLGVFSFPFRNTITLINFVIYMAVLGTLDTSIVNITKYFNKKYSLLCLSIIFIVLFITIYRTYNALTLWQEMNNYSKVKEINKETIKKIYKKTYPELCNNEAFLQSYSQFLFSTGNIQESTHLLKLATIYSGYYLIYVGIGRNYLKMGKNQKAEKYLLKATNMVPNRFVPKEWLMLYYYLTDNNTKTLHWINNILSYPIKVPSKRIDSIRQEAIRIKKKINLDFSNVKEN